MDKLTFTEKFEGQDFHTWQIQMQLHLIQKDLWDVKPNSIIPTDANELAKWNIKNQKASGTIGIGLSKAYYTMWILRSQQKKFGSH